MPLVFFGVIIVCFPNILSTSTQNLKLENIPQLFNQNRSLRDHIDEANQVFFPGNSECSRYCIKTPEDRVVENAVILWNTTQNTLFAFYEGGPVISRDDRHDIRKSMKSVLYVNIGCKNSTSTNGAINNNIESPALVRVSDGKNDEKFTVKNGTKLLIVTVAQENNSTSSLLLEMPLESKKTENNGVLELSLIRNSITNKLHVTMINPPVGKWRIKLSENETTSLIDSINIHHNIIKMENITAIKTSKTMNSPEKLRLRDTDDSGINPTEDENTIEVKNNLMETLDKYTRIVTNTDMTMGDKLADLTKQTNDLKSRMKALVVDLALETTLVVPPNTIQPIIFTIKNYLPTIILCTFRGSSSQFRIVTITPPLGWIRPGEIFKVAVYIQMPNANEGIRNTVTLYVEHQSDFEDMMKSAYIYVKNFTTKIADYTKPTIDYSFNNNCAGKLDAERCDVNEWSADITVTDNESGVKNVLSQPNGIQSKTNFIAGMKGSVVSQYRSSCCNTTVRITAIDVAGNSHTREIDVTAWDNLTVGDIAAIIIGALFLLFIIIFTISLCSYCVKRRKSKDITFTQRYGSRSDPGGERTNF